MSECQCCGQPVRIAGTTTQYYEPICMDALLDLYYLIEAEAPELLTSEVADLAHEIIDDWLIFGRH